MKDWWKIDGLMFDLLITSAELRRRFQFRRWWWSVGRDRVVGTVLNPTTSRMTRLSGRSTLFLLLWQRSTIEPYSLHPSSGTQKVWDISKRVSREVVGTKVQNVTSKNNSMFVALRITSPLLCRCDLQWSQRMPRFKRWRLLCVKNNVEQGVKISNRGNGRVWFNRNWIHLIPISHYLDRHVSNRRSYGLLFCSNT
jgi:hypothetical protein